ncbi:cation diffusion facilitator family transporter [Nitrosopumilus sp. Nsub]|uniref:cation diffusion facilitator family transporter n=1 Tax=Nitrosopumilus sp. Nsub TaxID=1776294 RepID=UPI00082AA190|nr:cation diffusion facilitator family transporter [Nitrosopumilus sp. Nsub]
MTRTKKIQKRLSIVFIVSLSTFGFQITGGILSNSLALIADSFHLLIDFSAIAIALLAFKIAQRPHNLKMTFGFHRAEIVAAFINGISLLIMAGFILHEAYDRITAPQEIETNFLLVFASVGLLANIVMALILKEDSHTNLNVKGSYLHVLGDLVSSVGVVVGTLLIIYFDAMVIDSIISIGIAILVAHSGIRLSKKCLHIFMEGTPEKINLADIENELEKLDEIINVHDLHIWTLTSNMHAMSVHVKVRDSAVHHINEILKKINQIMQEKFGITHCTIQIEDDNDLINP